MRALGQAKGHSQSCRSSGPETSEMALAMAATSWKCQVR